LYKLKAFYKYPLFASLEQGEPPLVETAANIFRQLCYDYRDQLTAGIIVAGWDKRKGGQVMQLSPVLMKICLIETYQQVYCIPIGGMLVRQSIAIGGSGSTYVYGYVDANYKEKMTKEACRAFAGNSN
jgi:20S proteasome subunit beta 1